jgi:hypothetical protein
MKSITRGLLAATAIALVAACNRPNLRSTGGGYTPDGSAAPLAAPASGEGARPAGIDVPPPAPEPASGPQSSAPAGTATPR